MRTNLARVFCSAIVALAASFVAASSLNATPVEITGEKTIYLITTDGRQHDIGKVMFKPDGDATAFSVALDESKFTVHFLSMRNFRCIAAGKQKICHLPYFYKNKRRITSDDLIDLEYDLLFVRVAAGNNQFDAWNGLYYDLAVSPTGSLTGTLKEADLNVLAVPPEEDFARPISEVDMALADPETFKFPRLEIR